MPFVADFHIHSKYSRATSPDMDVDHIVQWAKLKGVDLMGSGDFTHPQWILELKEKLEPIEYGLFRCDDIYFMLTVEVSNIYSKNGKTHKVHNIIFAPTFEVVSEIGKVLGNHGILSSDGRPILSLHSDEMARMLRKINPDIFIVPAHAWTPWFSVFGSKSGFDSIEECYGEQTQYIYALETGLSCYDEKTEVLTIDGWKKFCELRSSDKICTLNPKNDKIEFHLPTKILTYKYKGKMYRLKTKIVDLLVTPNHKLLYSPCDFRNPKPYSLKEAQSLFNKSKRLKKDGIWLGENPKYFILPALEIKHGSRHYSGFRNKKKKKFPIKHWLKFFGFWVAEGWVSEGKNGDYNVCVCNKDAKLLNEMKRLLISFGYKVYQNKTTIRVRDYQLFHYLKRFGKSSFKFIPIEVKLLSKELLEILLKYYIKGDGHVYGRSGKGLSATTSSIRLRDDLQEIALKIGISAYYKIGRKKNSPILSMPYKGKVYRTREDVWIVYFLRRSNRPIVLPSTVKKYGYAESWVDYNGSVFCATVPNHVMYIRRNGIPLWCGNSDPAMNWRWSGLDRFSLISNSDSHSPSKIGREANVFKDRFGYKELIDILKTKDRSRFLYTIEFFPQEGKYHWDGHRNCNVSMSPKDTKRAGGKCPACGRRMTIGVMNRVDALSDRGEGIVPDNSIPFKSLVPLGEIIADVCGVKSVASVTVQKEYRALISNFGTELNILLDAKEEDLARVTTERIASAITRVRRGEIKVIPGYDGVYGQVKVFAEEAKPAEAQQELF